MLVKACKDYFEDDGMWDYKSYSLCRMNGGEDTMDSWERDPMRGTWYHRLRELPTWDTYENENGVVIILSHAGFTPWYKKHTKECFVPTDRMLIWDRDHYLEEWVEDEMDSDVIVVHGHTPIHYIAEKYEPGAFWYCGNRKCCIDNATFHTGIACLLDLNTFDEHIFQSKVKI
jgi:hypothetical protein